MSIQVESGLAPRFVGKDRVVGTQDVVEQEQGEDTSGTPMSSGDRAIRAFGQKSLYNLTNQYGVQKPFIVDKKISSISSDFAYPESLRTARHAVPDFWVYDGAHPTIGHTGKINTSRDQILPNKRITEQDAMEWQRVGSKKGWMFNGPPQQDKPGFSGEDMPTHTSDGYIKRIQENRWNPVPRSEEKQGLAVRELPAIDIENNARGIGVTGPGSGSGGMSGGHREVTRERLARLPIPMARYNWTGTRLQGTAREDQGGNMGSGAGGYRAGYNSMYPDNPSQPMRRTAGLSRVTQNAA